MNWHISTRLSILSTSSPPSMTQFHNGLLSSWLLFMGCRRSCSCSVASGIWLGGWCSTSSLSLLSRSSCRFIPSGGWTISHGVRLVLSWVNLERRWLFTYVICVVVVLGSGLVTDVQFRTKANLIRGLFPSRVGMTTWVLLRCGLPHTILTLGCVLFCLLRSGKRALG